MPSWEPVLADTRLYRATYSFGRGGSATAFCVGLAGDDLMVVSTPGGRDAPPLLEALAGLGTVRAIVVPCGFHRMGVAGTLERFPEAEVFADERIHKKIVAAARRARPRGLDALAPLLPEGVEVLVPPHMKRPDTIVRVATPDGPVWYLNDIVTNMPSLPNFFPLNFLMPTLGFRTGLAVNEFGMRFVLAGNRPGLSAWLAAELRAHPPHLLVAGHGPVVRDPAKLAGLADMVERDL